MRFRTLRGRLVVVAMLAATVAVALAVLGFNLVLSDLLHRDIDQRVRTEAAAIATTVAVAADGTVSVRESSSDEAIDGRVWVFAGTRPVVAARAPADVEAAARALAGRSGVYGQVGEHGTRLYAQGVRRDGRQVATVVAAESLAAYDRTTDLAQLTTLILGLLLLAGALLATWLLVGRALAPVTEMTRSAAAWGAHDTGRRFGPADRPDELGELARTFDALLNRIAAALRHEQRLSAELSHELRTPLARISAEMELLQRRERSPADRAAAYEVIARSGAQMSRILESLMAAARAEATGAPGRSNLGPTLDDLAAGWPGPAALEVGGAVDGDVGADGDVVERILSPLLDNAARFARARVAVTVIRGAAGVAVRVGDDGPGIPVAERAGLFEPGVRGAAVDGHAGAGLGLALARRLARAAGGDVVLDPAAPGATFVVTLPA